MPRCCRLWSGAGLYFEVAPKWVWIGGGLYAPDTAQLTALREHIAQNHRQLASIVTSTGFQRLGGLQGARLTRVARAFAKAARVFSWASA